MRGERIRWRAASQTTGTARSHAMSTISKARTSQIIRRVTQVWAELDHAQRRLLEIRTGLPELTRRERRGHDRAEPLS